MKILILGLSGSGKSTVSRKLANKYNLTLIEADDEVLKANGGVWPHDYNTRDEFIDKIFEETNKKVIEMNNVIYVTSWLTPERIKDFRSKRFVIVEMHADFDVLVKRKNGRDGESEERVEKFKNTYISYFQTILAQDMLDEYALSIDTSNMDTDEIGQKIASAIL